MDKQINHLSGDQLCDYAEGTLDLLQRGVADAHLATCEACRRELQVVQGYFTDMAALEHVPAPANFLAKVRERIEKPSTGQIIQRWLAGFWRVVPVQFALLTLLGVTILIAYLQQNGGLHSRAISEIPAAAQPQAEPASPAPSLPDSKVATLSKSSEPADLADREASQQGLIDARLANEVSGGATMLKKSMPEEADALTRRDKANAEASLGKDEPVPVAKLLGKSKFDSDDEAEAKKTEMLAEGFGDLKGNASAPAAQAAPPAAPAPSLPEVASKRSASADLYARSESAPMRKAKEEKAAPLPTIVLHLATGKDTVALFNGLKAMGAQVLGENLGNKGLYELDIPASMLGDLPAYLGRYGKVEMPKPMPVVEVTVKLRAKLHLVFP